VKLHDLRPAPGSTKPRTRVGRGIAAGKGKTAGRGTKGQKSRAGASIPAWFEGGQTPLHVRVPKLRGFKRRGRIEYQVVNVGRISEYAAAGRFGADAAAGETLTVNAEVLAAAGPCRMGCGVDVETQGRAVFAVGRARHIFGSVSHHDLDLVILGMDAFFHGRNAFGISGNRLTPAGWRSI